MKVFSALALDGHAVQAMRERSSAWWWTYLLVAAIILAIPLTRAEVSGTPFELGKMVFVVFVYVLAAYGLSRLFGGRSSFKVFAHPLSRIIAASSLLILVLAVVSIVLFEVVFDVAAVSNLVTSVLPFYLVVLWAFSAEQLALVRGWRRPVYGSVCVVVLGFLLFFV